MKSLSLCNYFIFLMLFLSHYPLIVLAEEESNSVTVLSVKEVFSGSQFKAYFPERLSAKSIRVRGVETPKIKGLCDGEITAALQAKQFVRYYLDNAEKIVLVDFVKEKYNKTLATVYVDDVNLANVLIYNDLGKVWSGQQVDWCN
ncbi:thermonuclease family protein [Shewanella surugensis]|uniref:Thermonuclease family protein n=1 Tax=Shewanella surugensis TaxID=212020 RepID=A0ABT0LK46_9GAMM|nr:thermonuclease family protein [Shewanella surugensis]MCL1127662.1 thermonuclease family protein [Shewanella surugensis]